MWPNVNAKQQRRAYLSTLSVVIGLALLFTVMVTRAGTTKHYTFGVFPYLSAEQLSQSYGPVAAEFGRALKRPVRFTSAPTYEAFARGLTKEIYDIAMIQPFDYVAAVDQHNYQPLARVDADLRANFVVRPDNPYKTLEDLRGSHVALPSATAAVSRIALKALLDAGLQPGVDVQVRHFKSFGSCMQDVLIGHSSACATGKAAKKIFEKRMQVSLRILHETPVIPHMTFVAHKRIPAAERTQLQTTIVNWKTTTDGQRIIKGMRFPGFRAVVDQEYDVIRRMEKQHAVPTPVARNKKQLALGVIPYFPPRHMAEHLAPVPTALSRVAGRPVVLRSTTTYSQFATNLKTGLYDIALIQPFDYGRAMKFGYVPLARRQRDLTTVFYVLNSSPLHTLTDLKATVVAMPPYEAAVSNMGRRALQEAGLTLEQDLQIRYRRDHISCLRHMLLAEASACVSGPLGLTFLNKTERQNIRELHRTPLIAGLAFVAHSRLPENLRAQLKTEILSWGETEDGRMLLQAINYEPFVNIKPSDYACCMSVEE